jgi:outer membrane protein assembly factor BamB
VVFLSGCASKEGVIEPTPLQKIEQKTTIKKRWSKQIGSGFEAGFANLQPALWEDRLFAADANGKVYALAADTGRVHWRVNLSRRLVGGIGVDGDYVWLSTLDGALLALDAQTGALSWSSPLSSESLAPVAITPAYVVVQTQDAHLACLDRLTGKKRWVVDTKVPVLTLRGAARPRIAGNAVVAGFANGKLMSFDLETGQNIWERQIGIADGASELDRIADIDGNFLIDRGAIFVSGYQGRLAALDTVTGRPFWLQPDVGTHQALGIGFEALYVADAQGVVWAVDVQSGQPLWQQEAFIARRLSGPSVVDDYVIFGDLDGYIHFLSPKTGELLGRQRIDRSPIRTQPLTDLDKAYVISEGGKLVALTVQ